MAQPDGEAGAICSSSGSSIRWEMAGDDFEEGGVDEHVLEELKLVSPSPSASYLFPFPHFHRRISICRLRRFS